MNTSRADISSSGDDRGVAVFLYGLFMDVDALRARGFTPRVEGRAVVRGRALRLGRRATLVPAVDGDVPGVLMRFAPAELDALSAEEGVRDYRPEPVLAACEDGTRVSALCYTLPDPPPPDACDSAYAERLRALAARLGLPTGHVDRALDGGPDDVGADRA